MTGQERNFHSEKQQMHNQETLTAAQVETLVQETHLELPDKVFYAPAVYRGKYFVAYMVPSLVLNHKGYLGLPFSPRKLLEHADPDTYRRAVASFIQEKRDALNHANIKAGNENGDTEDMLAERRKKTKKIIQNYKYNQRRTWRKQGLSNDEIEEKTGELFTGHLPQKIISQLKQANDKTIGNERQKDYYIGLGGSLKYAICPTGENGDFMFSFNPETGQTTVDVYTSRRAFHWYRLFSNPQIAEQIAQRVANYEIGKRVVPDEVRERRVQQIKTMLLDGGRITGNAATIKTSDGKRQDTRRSEDNFAYILGQGTGVAALADVVLGPKGMQPAVNASFEENIYQELKDERGIQPDQVEEIIWTVIIFDLLKDHNELGGRVKLKINSRQAMKQMKELKLSDITTLFERPEPEAYYVPDNLQTLEKQLAELLSLYPPTHAGVELGDAFNMKFEELLAEYKIRYKNYSQQINVQRLAYAHAKTYALNLAGKTDKNYDRANQIVQEGFAQHPDLWEAYVAREQAEHAGDPRYQPRDPTVLPKQYDPTMKTTDQFLQTPEQGFIENHIMTPEEIEETRRLSHAE